MKFEKQFILLSICLLLTNCALSASNSTTAQSKPVSQSKTAISPMTSKSAPILTCNRDILNSHGLEGLVTPQAITFESCGTIRRSCCTRGDEVKIAENWLYGKERKKIKSYYEADRKVYTELWRQLSKVSVYADTLIEKIPKAMSNCKLLAQSVAQFEIEEVKGRALQNLRNMSDFFQTVHSGYSCSICNFDNHAFIDAPSKTLVFSKNFCRELVKKTLPPLLLFQADIVQLLNIITKLLTSCTSDGNLIFKAEFPSHLMFVEDKLRSFKLNQCMKFRNSRSNWFDNCKDLCQNFHPAKFSSYFAPHKLQITKFTRFVKTKLNDLKKAAEKVTRSYGVLTVQMPTMAEVKTTAKPGQGSSATPTASSTEARDKTPATANNASPNLPAPAQTTQSPATSPSQSTPGATNQVKPPGSRKLQVKKNGSKPSATKKVSANIFKLIPGAKVDTSEWKVEFASRGFDLLVEGEAARISERVLKRIKTSLMLERLNITSPNVTRWMTANTTFVMVNDTGVNIETSSRLLNNAGIMSLFTFMFSALITL